MSKALCRMSCWMQTQPQGPRLGVSSAHCCVALLGCSKLEDKARPARPAPSKSWKSI